MITKKLESLFSLFSSIATTFLATSLQEKVGGFVDKSILYDKIKDYLSHQKSYNELCSLAEEIDFAELESVDFGEIADRTQRIINGETVEKREQAKKDLISYVSKRVSAKSPKAKDRVKLLVSELTELIIGHYRSKIIPEQRVLANDTIEEIKNEQERTKKEILSAINKQIQQIRNERSSFYFGKNTEMARANSPYAYNARAFTFVGREKELEFLREFLNDSAKCLWMSLSGNASIGKKRLVYQFFEELDQSEEWDHTGILRHIRSLSHILNDIEKNTVICLEYAAEYLQEINEFLAMAVDRFTFCHNIKIRIILIEREPIEILDTEEYGLYELKKSYYQGLHLQPLSSEEIRDLIASYTEDVDHAVKKFQQLDPTGEKITLLFLVADQNEDKENYDALQYWYNNEHEKIRSYQSVIPAESIHNLIVYSTMLGGSDLTVLLKTLHYDEEETEWIQVLTRLGYYRDGYILPIEPSILGEFFCLQSFNEFQNTQMMLDSIAEEDLYSLSAFFERLYVDYDIKQFTWADKITCLNIPDTHSRIPSWIFKGRRFIHSVLLGEGVVEIGRSAFQGCVNLGEVTIMPMLETISANAFRDCKSLKNVRLQDKKDNSALRRLGRCCFKGCSSLENIELPSTCAEIEEQVFYRCESLKQIELPRSLRAVSPEAFAYCYALEGIKIKSKCKEIGTSAFLNAVSLKYVRGANQVEAIRGTAFKGCKNLCKLPLFGNATNINSGAFEGDEALEQVDLSKTHITIINKKVFSQCLSLHTVLLPNGVRAIGDSAFEGAVVLKTISPTGEIRKVGSRAFYGCKSLETLDFLNGIRYLGTQAIEGCAKLTGRYKYKESICFSGLYIEHVSESVLKILCNLGTVKKLRIPSAIKKIEAETFVGLEDLEEIIIEDAEDVGDRCFKGCINLRKVQVNAQRIGEGAFFECYNLEQVKFGKNVKRIENNAFAHCVSLRRIEWPKSHSLEKIGKNALVGTSIQRILSTKNICGFSFKSFGKDEIVFLQNLENARNIKVPRTVTSLSRGAFQGLSNVREIQFEGCISNLPAYAFADCEQLEKIIIQKPFDSIGDNAFQGCKNLVSFCPDNDISKTVIGKGIFSGCESLEAIKLNQKITTIPQYMFFRCRNLKLSLPSCIESIGQYAFKGCDQLTSFVFSGSNIGFGAFMECRNLTTVDLSRSKMTEIKNDVFQEDGQLHEIFLPVTLKKIGNGAFKECKQLEILDIPARVQEIGIGTLQNCNALREINIPNSVRYIKSHAFRGCYSLSSVRGLSGLINLGASAFFECVSLREICLPEGLESVGNAAFYACKKLNAISIPSSLKNLSDGLFERCEGLTVIQLHPDILEIPVNFAKDCFALKNIEIPKHIRSLGAGAFRNCEMLSHVNIPEGVTEIAASTFFGCKGLEKISLPTTLRKIMQTAFYKCSRLKNVDINGPLTWIGAYAFAHAGELEDFPFAMIEGTIGDAAFKFCKSISGIQFGSITGIGNAAFWGCDSLTIIDIINLKVVPGAAFRKCKNLWSVRLEKSVNLISRAAFRECAKLQQLDIQGDFIKIQANAFYDCERLRIINLPEKSAIDSEAFINCPAEKYVNVK